MTRRRRRVEEVVRNDTERWREDGPDGIRIGETDVGRGVFVTRAYAAGEYILTFRGEVIDFGSSNAKGDRECDALQVGPNTYLDLEAPAVFINHSCSPNVGVRDDLQLVALRAVAAGEEIRYDYSTTMDEDRWTMECRCGSPHCRVLIGDFKRLPKETQLELIGQAVVQKFIIAAGVRAGWLILEEIGGPGRARIGPGSRPATVPA